jgi:hypothetical protein
VGLKLNGDTQVIVRKARRKDTTRKSKTRWMDNVKMYLVETIWSGADWIGLAQDGYSWRVLVNAVMNFRVP